MNLLKLLAQAFGKRFINDNIGRATNVVKPTKFDVNAPTKGLYSDDAFEDPKLLDTIEEKLREYAPMQFANKNMMEVRNYEQNLEKFLKAKNKQMGVTEQMKSVKEPKPEAEIFDIKTKEKVSPEGIMSLREDVGLGEGIEPGSPLANLKQDIAKLKKEAERMKTTESTLGEVVENMFGIDPKKSFSLTKEPVDVLSEGNRRGIIRQLMIEDEAIRKQLSPEEFDDLVFAKDLDKGADPNKDPMKMMDRFYERDENLLDMLDTVLEDLPPNSTPAEITKEFRKRTGGLKLKKPREDKADGGRMGFAAGGIKALLSMMNKKFGKDTMKTADEMDLSEKVLKSRMFEDANKRFGSMEEIADDVSPGFAKGDSKYNAQVLAEALANSSYGKDYYDLPIKTQIELYDRAYKFITDMGRMEKAGGGLSYLMGM